MYLEIEDPIERSLARDALQSNLDTTLTLNRKKSGWFGSTRDAVTRGALQAKEYVGSLRGENPAKAEEDEPTEPCRRPEHQQSFSPKRAFVSFRQHVQIQGNKSKQKRGALADVHGMNIEGKDECPDGSEKLDGAATTIEHADGSDTAGGTPGHSKKGSVGGGTFIGSIRRMAAKATNSPPKGKCIPIFEQPPLSVQPAPALSLDMEAGFAPELALSAVEGNEPATEVEVTTPTTPITPIRCINLGKESDGYKQEDLSRLLTSTPDTLGESLEDGLAELFERSVVVEKSLKRMVSLDAIAEQYTQSPVTVPQTAPPERRLGHRRSSTTIFSCPSDMEELERQDPPMQVSNDSGYNKDDPFVGLMPTPLIEIHGPNPELPYCPDPPPQEAEDEEEEEEEEEEAMADLSSLDGHIFKSGVSSVIIPSSPEQKARNPDEEHRFMVTEVLDITGSDGPEFKDAISENYDLQVAMGFTELGIGELQNSTGRGYSYHLLADEVSGSDPGSPGSGSSGKLLPAPATRVEEDSLDEALNLYKTYNDSQDGLHDAFVKAADAGFEEALVRRQTELLDGLMKSVGNDLINPVEEAVPSVGGPSSTSQKGLYEAFVKTDSGTFEALVGSRVGSLDTFIKVVREAEQCIDDLSSPDSARSVSSVKRKPLPSRYRSKGSRA